MGNTDPALRKSPRILGPKALALLSGGAIMLTGCGSQTKSQPKRTIGTPGADPSFKFNGPLNLPKRAILSPRKETPESCSTSFFTPDHPAMPVSTDPKDGEEIVRVDGRCNTPLSSEEVGVYDSTSQKDQSGRPIPPSFNLLNGDAVAVICTTTQGEPISDFNGDVSKEWLGIVAAKGEGFMPDTNAAFVPTPDVPSC